MDTNKTFINRKNLIIILYYFMELFVKALGAGISYYIPEELPKGLLCVISSVRFCFLHLNNENDTEKLSKINTFVIEDRDSFKSSRRCCCSMHSNDRSNLMCQILSYP